MNNRVKESKGKCRRDHDQHQSPGEKWYYQQSLARIDGDSQTKTFNKMILLQCVAQLLTIGFQGGILFRAKPSSDPNGPTLRGSWVEPIQHIQIRCWIFQAGWLHPRSKKNYQAGKKDGAAPKNGFHLIIKRIKFHITECIHHSMKWYCDQLKEWLRNTM